MLLALGEQAEPAHEIVDVAEGASLGAVAKYRERLAFERLAEERGDGAPVVPAHPRSVGVEDARDAGVDPLLAVVRHRERLGVALRFVVDPAGADRVHVAPVRLGLRVHLRVAVDLARGGEQEPGTLDLGQPEHVVRPVGAHLERVEGQAQVVDGARRAGEVKDHVHGLLEKEWLGEVVLNEPKIRTIPDVLNVLERAGIEVVNTDDPISVAQKEVTYVRAEETGAARHYRSPHAALPPDVSRCVPGLKGLNRA